MDLTIVAVLLYILIFAPFLIIFFILPFYAIYSLLYVEKKETDQEKQDNNKQ